LLVRSLHPPCLPIKGLANSRLRRSWHFENRAPFGRGLFRSGFV